MRTEHLGTQLRREFIPYPCGLLKSEQRNNSDRFTAATFIVHDLRYFVYDELNFSGVLISVPISVCDKDIN
jgi:hypothetical protein